MGLQQRVCAQVSVPSAPVTIHYGLRLLQWSHWCHRATCPVFCCLLALASRWPSWEPRTKGEKNPLRRRKCLHLVILVFMGETLQSSLWEAKVPRVGGQAVLDTRDCLWLSLSVLWLLPTLLQSQWSRQPPSTEARISSYDSIKYTPRVTLGNQQRTGQTRYLPSLSLHSRGDKHKAYI